MRKRRIWFTSIITLLLAGTSWNLALHSDTTISLDKEERRWVDSIFHTLTPKERIGQLFMIRAHSDLGADHTATIKSYIKKYHIGGLCFFQGTPAKQAALTNQYQQLTEVPLMVAMDAEWGLGMRFKDSAISFPHQLMLGAIQDNRLIYDMGAEIARELRRIGAHVNFAPVVDVNNNPGNPVINTRSFGEDRLNVSVKSYMYAIGMQDHEVMACAKHFPGHGDTDIDSHLDLPVIQHSMKRLDSVELYPFRILSQHGIASMMVAHLHVPALDPTLDLPTTLSRPAITSILKNKLNFKGLIFTDALEMKGVTKHFPKGEIEVRAIEAGNDVLLLPEDIGTAFDAIEKALASGRLQQTDIDRSVKKILRAKYRLGLSRVQRVNLENLKEEVNTQNALALKRKLIANALTLVHNLHDLIPIRHLEKMNFASLSIGARHKTEFQNTLSKYAAFEHWQVDKTIYSDEKEDLLKALAGKDVVFVGLHDMSRYEKRDYGLTPSVIDLIDELQQRTKVILTVFGNPYSLKYFENIPWLLAAYEDNGYTQDLAAQGLFGAFGFRGRLPVSASNRIPFNAGITTTGLFRLGYALPEETGLRSETLEEIDAIMEEAIEIEATPGGVVLVAKDGKVVFNKAYGHHTYDDESPVTSTEDIFDLASITKIAATTLSVMKLQEKEKLDINQPLSIYLPDLAATNKKALRIEDIMRHRAGLIPWLPLYKNTVSGSRRHTRPSPKYYRHTSSVAFSIPVATNLYLSTDYESAVWNEIFTSKVYNERKYRYSDLGFYMMGQAVGETSGTTLDEFVQGHFYKSMGLKSMTFNPWQKFPISMMPPTEEDSYFRGQRVQGYVHDSGAAILGGVSGHAGLFSNANDLAKLMQMLLNKGYYGGKRYLKNNTIKDFTTRCAKCPRRGIGFDMKDLNGKKSNLPAAASKRTFGHLGFTGTCVWSDPKYNLTYIFLSNRTYPSMTNFKLNEADIRKRIHEVIYKALEN